MGKTVFGLLLAAWCLSLSSRAETYRRGDMALEVNPVGGQFKVYRDNLPILEKEWNKIELVVAGKSVVGRLLPGPGYWTKSGVREIREDSDGVTCLWYGERDAVKALWGVRLRSDSFALIFDVDCACRVDKAEIGYYIADDYFRGGTFEADGTTQRLSWDRLWPDKTFNIKDNGTFVAGSRTTRVSYGLKNVPALAVEDRRKNFNGYYFRLDIGRRDNLSLKGEIEFRFDNRADIRFKPLSLAAGPTKKDDAFTAFLDDFGAVKQVVHGGVPLGEIGGELKPVILDSARDERKFAVAGNYGAFYFLAAASGDLAGKDAMSVHFKYADGAEETKVFKGGTELQPLVRPEPGEGRLVTVQKYGRDGERMGLTLYRLDLNPEKTLQTIGVRRLNGRLAIFGAALTSRQVELKRFDAVDNAALEMPPLNVLIMPQKTYRDYSVPITRVPNEFKSDAIQIKRTYTVRDVANRLKAPRPNALVVMGGFPADKEMTYPDYAVDAATAKTLASWIKDGTGLLFCRDLSKKDYENLADVLPVETKGVESVDLSNKNALVTLTPDPRSHALLRGVQWANFPAVKRYVKAVPKKGAETLARLSDGSPALVAWNYGKGRVLWSAIDWGASDEEMNDCFRDGVPFAARTLYWVSGNDKFVGELSALMEGRLTRGEFNDALAGYLNAYEDVNALARYARDDAANAFLTASHAKVDDALAEAIRGDALQGNHNFSESAPCYRKSLEVVIRERAAIDSLYARLRDKFVKVELPAGKPIVMGAHHDNWLWADKLQRKPGNPLAHQYRREQEYLREKKYFDFNMISIGHGLSYFLRDDCDPAVIDENDFQFDIYDHFIEIARKHKLALMVFAMQRNYGAEAEARNARMLLTPECDPIEWRQKGGGAALKWNMWNDTVRDRRYRLLKTFAAGFDKREDVNIVGIQRDNEDSGMEFRDEKAFRRFREFLKARYGSIDKANARYGSTFKDFDAIVPPSYEGVKSAGKDSSPERAVWHDWREFVDNENLAYYKAGYEGLKAGSSWIPASARFSYNGTSRGNDPGCLPYDKVIRYYDIAGGQHHASEIGMDYVVGMAGGRFKNMSEYYSAHELPTGAPRNIPGFAASLQMYDLANELPLAYATSRQLWRCFARGVEQFQCHNLNPRWMCDNPDKHALYEKNMNPRLRATPLKYAKNSFERFNGLMEGSQPWFQGGIVTVRDSHYQIPGTPMEKHLGDYGRANERIRENFLEDHILFDQVPEDADFSRYPVLIFHQATYLSDKTAEKVLAYVRGGGVFVSVEPSGVYDEYSRPDNKLQRELFGVTKTERKSFDTSYVGYNDGEVSDKTRVFPELKDNAWAFALAPDSRAKVLARFNDGAPVLLEAAYGKGKAYLMGFDWLGTARRYYEANAVIRDRLIKSHLPEAPVTIDRPDIHLYVRTTKDGGYLIFLTNSRLEPLRAGLAFKVGENQELIDCRAAVVVPQTAFDYVFCPGDARVYWIRNKTKK